MVTIRFFIAVDGKKMTLKEKKIRMKRACLNNNL